MVSGCVGFVGDFALTFGSSWSSTARFVRKVSSFFQVYSTLLGDRSTYTRCLLTRAAVTISCGDNSAPTQQSVANGPNQPWYEVVGVVRDPGIDPEKRDSRRARVYHPLVAGGSYPVRMAVHTTGDPLLFASRLRSLAREVEPTLQISDIARFDQVAAAAGRTMTLLFWLFLALAIVVVMLSLTGIYTVLSFIASQRAREVGIRVDARRTAPARDSRIVPAPTDASRTGYRDRIGHRGPRVGGRHGPRHRPVRVPGRRGFGVGDLRAAASRASNPAY